MKNLDGMSGCELVKHIESIGLDNIKMFASKDELLAKYDDDEIIDELVNNNDRDIRQVIVALFECCIVPNDGSRNELMSKLDSVLNEVM
jgi:hypothetical protein